MLDDSELERLFVDHSLPDAGREFIRTARRNSPVRSPTSNGGNILVYHYSRKMGGRHLGLESHTVEAEAASLYEDDERVLEFWPQPCRVDLQLKNRDGQIVGRQPHTPDFLVIKAVETVVEEWRMESRLLRLAGEGDQFYKDEGGWHFRAAEEYFAALGLRYHLRSAVELPHILIQNVRFLRDYQLPTCPPVNPAVEAALLDLLKERGSVPFEELIRDKEISADDVFKYIVKKSVAVNLQYDRLDRPSEFYVHRDMAIARAHHALVENQPPVLPIPGIGKLLAGSTVTFNGKAYRVALVGGGKVLLQDSDGQRIELDLDTIESMFAQKTIDIAAPADAVPSPFGKLTDYTTAQLERAERRLEALERCDHDSCSERSRERWSGKIIGLTNRIDKLLALTDDQDERGNRTPRFSDENPVETLAKEIIDERYNTPTGPKASKVWLDYKDVCERENVVPMSYPTFTKRVKKFGSVKAREGAKKAYQVDPIPLFLDYVRPVHGVRPHDVVYIDHTIATMDTVGVNGTNLGKPTLTFAADGHTTQQRAMYLSYDPPSSAVVLMVLRDYVRKHHRLPRTVVVDGGADLSSREIQHFCRLYGVDLRLRKGKPRGGSPVERAFGVTEIELFAQLEGNTRIMRNTRMVTKEVNPFRRGEWTLTALHGALEVYLFDVRENRIHPTLGVTPKAYEAMRLVETGQREHTMIRFDETLMLMTSPHSKHWYHEVDRQRGVWADNMYYWHDCLREADAGEKVEVRVERWNANVIYICFRGRWVAAIARDLRAFAGRHRREVEIALREERRRAKVDATKDRQSRVSAKKMLELWSPEHFDERIGQQQREMVHLYARLGMTEALPQTPMEERSPTDLGSEPSKCPQETSAAQQPDSSPEPDSSKPEDDNLWSNASEFI